MMYIYKFFLVYLVIFVVVLFADLLMKKFKVNSSKSYNYIVKKYKLNLNKKRKRILMLIIDIVNALIITIPVYIIIMYDINYWLALIISLILFIILILLFYNLIGVVLKKKGW